MGDFNAEPNEPVISNFCKVYNTKNIIKEKTCFKNPANPTNIPNNRSNPNKQTK